MKPALLGVAFQHFYCIAVLKGSEFISNSEFNLLYRTSVKLKWPEAQMKPAEFLKENAQFPKKGA